MPIARSFSVDATELDTAPGMRSFMDASASMNLLTVEPVPTPTISPGTTYCSAACPTRALSSSCVISLIIHVVAAVLARPPLPFRPRSRDRARADAAIAGHGARHAAQVGVLQ